MKRILVVSAALSCASLAVAADRDLTEGKTKTERTVRLEAGVVCAPAEVYTLWSTAAGVKRFFAPEARIDARPGGEYTILFVPEKDPQGLSHGTRGARVLKAIPAKSFSFEWITFAGDAELGRNAPPIAPRSVRDASPLPTWVELDLEPAREGTHIRFAHFGFKDDALWDASYQWFTRAWAGVLGQLAKHCSTGISVVSGPHDR